MLIPISFLAGTGVPKDANNHKQEEHLASEEEGRDGV
jgi:hypothetical protein